MIRSDYILKMIAQLAVALRQVLKLRASKRDDDALREIDLTLQKLCGLNSHLVNALSEDSLAQTLRAGAALDIGKALVIAEMLHEEANILADRGDEEGSVGRYRKALRLYTEALLEREEVQLPDYRPRVDAVAEALEEFVLPVDLADRLIRYYEKQGDFAAAGDVVGLLLEDGDDGAEAVARSFHDRMRERGHPNVRI